LVNDEVSIDIERESDGIIESSFDDDDDEVLKENEKDIAKASGKP